VPAENLGPRTIARAARPEACPCPGIVVELLLEEEVYCKGNELMKTGEYRLGRKEGVLMKNASQGHEDIDNI
jgi:hypothetical protein